MRRETNSLFPWHWCEKQIAPAKDACGMTHAPVFRQAVEALEVQAGASAGDVYGREVRGSAEGGSPISRRRLGCAGNDGPHEIDAVYGYCDPINWRGFARDLRAAKSSGAGTDQDGRATLALRRKRKSKFQTRAGLDGNIGVKEDAGTGDITQLPGVIFERAVLGHTDLNRQVDLVASSFSALSHNIPPSLDARRQPRDFCAGTMKTSYLRLSQDSQVGNGSANSSHYRKYRHALMKFSGSAEIGDWCSRVAGLRPQSTGSKGA
jgi:hypothetical protein